jgi:hypothetical protein
MKNTLLFSGIHGNTRIDRESRSTTKAPFGIEATKATSCVRPKSPALKTNKSFIAGFWTVHVTSLKTPDFVFTQQVNHGWVWCG